MKIPTTSDPVNPTVPRTVDDLLDLEAIKVLKVKYWWAVDVKDWETYRSLFTDDGVVEIDDVTYSSVADVVALFEESIQGHEVIHKVHLPQIELTEPGEAKGIWCMSSVVRGEKMNHREQGVYHESYRKVDDEWLISHLSLHHVLLQPEGDTRLIGNESHWWESS